MNKTGGIATLNAQRTMPGIIRTRPSRLPQPRKRHEPHKPHKLTALRKLTLPTLAAAVLAAVLVGALALTAPRAHAQTPYTTYEGYTYDAKQRAAPSVNGYAYADSIDGYDSESGPFNDIQDLFVGADDSLYIVDGRNNRVVRMDNRRSVTGLFGDEQGAGKLNGPKGVFAADNGDVYVADTGNNRIAVFDGQGAFVRELGAPDSPLLGGSFLYLPSKVIVDKRGYLFVVSDGLYDGVLELSPAGEFSGFFGANHLPFSWTRLIRGLIATAEQKAQIASEKPPEFSNLIQDQEGFIYTTTLGIPSNQVKRLSAVGVDTLNARESARYGDYRMRLHQGGMKIEAFFDLTVDRLGLITALDQTTGKAFQYDSLGNLLFVFGGLGGQNGLFVTPTAIASSSDGSIYIADRTRNRIDRFLPTPFGELVHRASALYTDGKYEQAEQPWREVLELSSNYDLAYLAIGKSLYKQERYKEAMDYFRQARAQQDYSEAFREYRTELLRSNFALAVAGVAALYALPKLAASRRRKRRQAAASGAASSRPAWLERAGASMLGTVMRMAGQLLRHPVDFFHDVQQEGKALVRYAVIIVACAVAARWLSLSITSFLFQPREPHEISLLSEALLIIVPWLTWSLANWGISTLRDGEGKFKEILVGSAFALTPYIVLSLPLSLLTLALSLKEAALHALIVWLTGLWVAWLLLLKIKILHDFELNRTIGIAALTVFGMALIWVVLVLMYGLVNQAVEFVIGLFKEMAYRI